MEETNNIFSKKNYLTIFLGVIIVAIGFWMLSYVDAAAQNYAAIISPPTIIIGYILIGIGIVI